MPTAQDDRLAELVVQRGLLTPAQLSECRQLQSQSPTPCSLGQVIVSRRLATPEALRALAAAAGPGTASASAVRPTAGFGSAFGSGAGSSPVASGSASGSYGSPGQEDPDVAFGRYLFAQGTLTGEQVREAYKLLTGYKQQFPQVNLSQVLAKHGMADKETLRAAYQQWVAQRSAGTSPGTAAVAVPRDGRFGFKTVELDPQERPDFPGNGAPPPQGSSFFSPFAADAAPPPGVDPVTLDDFLPVDSSPQNPPPLDLAPQTPAFGGIL